ncbi:hypothetical protein [Spirosoma foliorum]|uniref:Uncharacterized protein n=1 Tax=Spirosoma foliorum TaxID=2710596 RepID=A0A7G5H4A4_9BACT|nr:hypothetical protein [Spirosoma foliorum]QMW05946.1 hypothetical protein H3H32_14130 [Spirosoma foliorum]
MNSIVSAVIASLLFQLSLGFHTAHAQPPKKKSLITHLVEEANQPNFHSEGDTFLLVKIGKVEYTAELKSGKIISQRKTQISGGGICGDYAEVSINLLDKEKHKTSQGAGQVLKLSKGNWKMIALSEGDYACEKLKGISKSVMACLKVECY